MAHLLFKACDTWRKFVKVFEIVLLWAIEPLIFLLINWYYQSFWRDRKGNKKNLTEPEVLE